MAAYFGLYDNLETGANSVQLKKEAKRNLVASALHLATREFGEYLNGATSREEFRDRLSYVLPELTDIIEKTASFEDIPVVLKSLAWNFDKKKDDGDSSDDSDKDSKSDDDSDSDKDSDSDSKSDDDDSDSDSGDDDDDSSDSGSSSSSSKSDSDSKSDKKVPDFVDTDKDDDDSRKESRRKWAEEVASEGFTGDLTDENLQPNPVSTDFDGDVNDLEPAGFNAVSYKIPGNPRSLTSAPLGSPQHLDNSFDPKTQWGTDDRWVPSVDYVGENGKKNPNGQVMPSGSGFNGSYYPPGQSGASPFGTFDSPDAAKAEVEKQFPETGMPGRHRASLPFVPRKAKTANPYTPADPKHLNNSFDPNSQWNNLGDMGAFPENGFATNDIQNANKPAAQIVPEGNGFRGDFYPGGNQSGEQVSSHPTQEGGMAELEKKFPQVGAPGQHRASTYPVVARNANSPKG